MKKLKDDTTDMLIMAKVNGLENFRDYGVVIK